MQIPMPKQSIVHFKYLFTGTYPLQENCVFKTRFDAFIHGSLY